MHKSLDEFELQLAATEHLKNIVSPGFLSHFYSDSLLFYLRRFSESRSSSGSTLSFLQSIHTCPRYIMRFAIYTAVFSEVRLGLVQYGVMGLK